MGKNLRRDELLAFCHIHKTGGITVNHVLRRHFGVRHVDVFYRRLALSQGRKRPSYNARDLRVDLMLHPFAKSVAGHMLKPFLDLGEYQERLVWHTVLREPISRSLSAYQHMVEKMGFTGTIQDWMKDWTTRSGQVVWLAGEEDVEAAKQVLATRVRAFGLTEKFNESLLIVRDRLGLDGMRVAYPRALNTSKDRGLRERIRDKWDEYGDDLTEFCELDLALYHYALQELWPKQVEDYGRERLERDLEAEFRSPRVALGDRLRWAANLAYRNAVYRPCIWVDRWRNLRREAVYSKPD